MHSKTSRPRLRCTSKRLKSWAPNRQPFLRRSRAESGRIRRRAKLVADGEAGPLYKTARSDKMLQSEPVSVILGIRPVVQEEAVSVRRGSSLGAAGRSRQESVSRDMRWGVSVSRAERQPDGWVAAGVEGPSCVYVGIRECCSEIVARQARQVGSRLGRRDLVLVIRSGFCAS